MRTNSWHRYWKDILQPGIPINISGALYLFFTYTDRYFIAHFRSAQTLSNYSLAWQLGQGALLLLTSMNVISSIRIGEQHKEETVRATLRHHLLLTGMAAVAALAGLVVLTYILAGTFYRGYQDLIPMTAIISAGYLGHGIAGSVTSFLTYHRRFGAVNLSYAGVVLTCIATNYAVITLGWRPMAALTLTTLGLLVMSTGLCLYTFLVASRMTRPVPVGQAT